MYAAEPFGYDVEQRGIDGQAGDDADQATPALDSPLIDCDQVQVSAVQNQVADLLAMQICRPHGKAKRSCRGGVGRGGRRYQ